MNEMHDWDIGNCLTLVLGLIATVGIFGLLVQEFIHGD